jgi:hypothetical protein
MVSDYLNNGFARRSQDLWKEAEQSRRDRSIDINALNKINPERSIDQDATLEMRDGIRPLEKPAKHIVK